jgi:hypothetical protein
MTRRTVALVVLFSGLTLAAAGFGPQREAGEPGTARFGNPTSTARFLQDYFYGVIKSLDKKEMVLDKTKFGIDQAVKLDAKTKYLHNEKPSSWDRLKVGDQVWVHADTNKKTGELTARKVLTGVVAPTIRK